MSTQGSRQSLLERQLQESLEDLLASRDELSRRNAELEAAQQLQRELVHFIVHDLKGPLTAVTANAEWVYEQLGGQPPALLEAMEDVLHGATRLRGMIGDLLLVSQLEHGTFPLVKARVDIDELVRKSIKQVRREAEQKEVTLVQSTELGGTADADPTLIDRVLSNLLDNSLRFTPPGGRIAVQVSAHRGLELRVANSGPAIPLAERARIFEKFARGEAGDRHLNAGLGLYFCRRAIEAHGGQIALEDYEDYPTCFHVSVPAA
jgi:signal transduction histidine kinase